MTRQMFDTEALNALPISEVAERYTNVVRKGTSLFCLCPCHDDHHPSMDVTGKKVNRAKCYSCGKSLSVIDLTSILLNVDFKGACECLTKDFRPTARRPTPKRPTPTLPKGREEGSYLGSEGKTPSQPPRGEEQDRHLGSEGRRPTPTLPKGREEGSYLGSGGTKRKGMGGVELMQRQKEIVERSIRRHHNLHVSFISSPRGGREGVFIPISFIVPSSNNTFCECLRSLFVPEGIDFAVKLYKLGTYKLGEKDGYVMFPSIDTEGRCHNIKIQRYCTDKSSPQYFHREKNANYWLASILQNRGELPPGNYDSTCFFGEHLLSQYPSATVVLVESPKNAVLGALGYGDYIWIAAGNKNNLSRERLQCLRNRKVIVIPDNDALEEWKQKLNTMQDIATFVFSSFCDIALGQTGAKGDVGDYIIEKV